MGDSVNLIKVKLGSFLTTQVVGSGTDLPTSSYYGEVFLGQGSTRRSLKEVDPDVIKDLNASKFHKKGWTDALYFKDGPKNIQVWDGNGQISSGVSVEVISGQPGLCNWGYVIVNEEPVYDPSASTNFVLHQSERPDLIIKILKLAGISMEDQQLYSAGSAEDGLNTQQENK